MRHPRRELTDLKDFAARRRQPQAFAPDEPQADRRRRRAAFTTIELLVVIGIILLLMAISVLAFRHLDKLASTKQTHAQLGICKNLLIEYERVNGMKYIEGLPNVPPTPGFPVYQDPAPTNPNAKINLLLQDLAAGPSFDVSAHTSASARYFSRAILNTKAVMVVLARIPANRTALTNVPSNRLLEAAPSPTGPPTGPPTIEQSIILDGWTNPIIFVPAGGMVVNIKDPSSGQNLQMLVRSSGSHPWTGQAPPTTALDRPFFASAGQDGDFSTGEDNVYSFQD